MWYFLIGVDGVDYNDDVISDEYQVLFCYLKYLDLFYILVLTISARRGHVNSKGAFSLRKSIVLLDLSNIGPDS